VSISVICVRGINASPTPPSRPFGLWPGVAASGVLVASLGDVEKPTRFDRANYYVRETMATLWRAFALALFAHFVIATIVAGHPPLRLAWLLASA
jgi:hypothetical protein